MMMAHGIYKHYSKDLITTRCGGIISYCSKVSFNNIATYHVLHVQHLSYLFQLISAGREDGSRGRKQLEEQLHLYCNLL